MKKDQIIEKIKSLNLPKNSFIAYGSCPLALAGIREANDIDLFVSPEIYARFRNLGWKKIYKGPGDEPLTFDVFEAHDNWAFCTHNPPFNGLLARATIIEDIPFASLDDVKKCKLAWGRPKDLQDVALIEKFLSYGNSTEH